MTELQRCEYDLLRSFSAVCGKLGLTWYLVCGSALGAVKYGGFIPWDDDIDVALPREDYELFLQKAPGLLPKQLFLQNYRTDPAFPHTYSKLRDSRTTCIEANAAHLPIHHGIFLDIFPLDGYPSGKIARLRLELRKKWYLHLLSSAFAPPAGLRHQLEYRFKRALGLHLHTASIAARYDALIRKYPARDSAVWCSHGNWQGQLDYTPRAAFGQGLFLPFEDMMAPVPADFHTYLTRKYGNYRADPPTENQVSHHRYLVTDCHRPYTSYWENPQ